MPLAAGKLNQRVLIQRAAEAHVDGEVRRRWVEVGSVWASVEPLSADEQVALGTVHGTLTHRVLIRWREDLRGSMRLVHRARVLELAGPPRDLDEARESLELLCREVE